MSILTDHTAEVGPPEAGFDMFAAREYIPPRANLLPPEIAERLALRKLIAAMVAGVIACGAIVGGVYSVTENGKAPAQAALVDAQTKHDSLVAQQTKLAPSQAAHQQVLAAKKALEAAVGSEVLWSDQLNSVRSHLTDGVRLKSLAVTETLGSAASAATAVTLPAGPANQPTSTAGTTPTATPASAIGTVDMSGVAVSNYALADWLDTLAKLHGWSTVYLSTSTADSDSLASSLVSFTITANITDAALSHRYTNGG